MPSTVRVEIVRRLRAGWSQKAVLEWLNTLPAVKTALRRERIGAISGTITANNLSAWLHSNPPETEEQHHD